MFNNLRIFKLKNDYTSKKGEFEYPTCSYVEEDDWVYFMEPVPTVKSFNVTLSYSKNVIDASGGTSTPTYSFSQEVEYDNGTTKTFTGSSLQPHSDAVVSWDGASNANGLVSANTKGSVESEQTLVASPIISIALNGEVATATSSVYQAANVIVGTSTSGGEITYGNVTKGTITNATIPAKGSTTNYTATASNGSQTWTKSDTITTYTYTSNATKDEVEKGTSGTNDVTPSPSSLSATASTKGTVTSNTTTVTSTTVTWIGQGGKSVSDTMYVYQEANKVESSSGGEVTYGNVVPGTVNVSQVIPASGGSATITATQGTQNKATAAGIYHYTSEATAFSSSNTVETIDVPYTISKSEVTARTRSNVTGNQLTIESVSVTWNGNDSKKATSSVTVYQQANSCSVNTEYTYGGVSKGSFSNKTIAASGGSATVSIGNGSQGRTGVTTSAYTSNVIETAQTVNDTVSVSPSISSLSGSANNRGTVTGTQLTITSSTVTWSANGKSASDTVYIYQEANTRSTKSVNTIYSNISVGTISANPLSIEFDGGTSYVTATNGSQTWEEITTYSYTSKEESTAVTDSGSIVVTPTVNPTELVFEALDGGEEGPCLTSVATWSANGKTATASTTVCQSSRSVTGTGITYSYGTVTAGTITNATIPASGSSTSYAATIRSGSQNYTAYTHNYWSDGTDEIVSETTGTTTISPSPSSLSATASTRGTTTGTQKTITSTTVTWASKDGSTSKNKTATAYVYQQANEVTSTTTARTYSYGTVTAGTINTATIPASGGSGTTTIENGSQKYTAYTATTYYYTSKDSNSANTNSSSGTTAATPNKTSLTASTSSRGTTTGSAINVTSTTITWTGGGSKTTTGTAYVKQEANTKTYDTSGVTQGSVSYGTVTAGTVTNTTIPAAGSSTNYTATASNGSQSWTRTDTPWSSYTFTSTSTAKTNGTSYETTGTTTISPSPSSLSATASTRGTTTGTQKTITSTTVTWASKDGSTSKNKTNTMYVYQEANAVTNSFYNTGITYNAPSVSIGSGMVASGGSATVTHSVTNTVTYYYLYTSNATSSAKTSGRTGTSTIKITSNGNSRFSLNGNTLSHSNMTTNATTDTVTITATNANSTGKTKTASSSITNSYSDATAYTFSDWVSYDIDCGAITLSKSSVGAGENVTVTATIGNGTVYFERTRKVKTTRTYTSKSEEVWEDSPSRQTKELEVACSVSPSTGFTFSNRGTTTGNSISKTFTGTCSGSGQSCTTTATVTQAANKKSYSTSGVSYGSKTYATPSCGTITLSKSSVGAGENVTVTATIGNGTQTWSRTATPWSAYTYTSGSETTSNGSAYTDSGSDSVSCSISPSSYSFSNRGTTTGATITKTFTGTCTANGKTCTTTKSVSQAANALESHVVSGSVAYTYGTVSVGEIYSPTAPASGTNGQSLFATAGNGSQPYTAVTTYKDTYTSTSTAKTTSTSTGTASITPVKSDGGSGIDYGRAVTSLGCTATTEVTVAHSRTVYYRSLDGVSSKDKSATMYIYQEANTYTTSSTPGTDYGTKTYATPSCGTITLSQNSVGAGESVTVTASISNGTQTWSRTVTPYTSYTYTHKSGCVSTGRTNGTAYSDTGSTSVSCTVSPASYSFSDRCTTTGAVITKTFTGTCTANGKTCTTTKSVSQAANTRSYSTSGVSYGSKTYSAVTAGSISNATVPANGGTGKATAGNGSQKWSRTATPWTSYTYTSGCGSTSNGNGYTDSGTDTITPNYSSTSATGSNLGCTAKSQTTLASRTVTWSGSGGKSATGTMYVYQEANVKGSTTYTWGSVTAGTITNATVPASGGTGKATAGNGSQKYSATTKYTASACTSTGTSSITPDYSSTSATGSNLGCTAKSATTLASRKVTWTGGGSKTASGTMIVSQEANVKGSTTYTWGALTKGSVSWSGDIPASGGTITVSATNGSQPYTATTKYTATACTSTGTSAITPSRTAGSASLNGSNLSATTKSRTAKGYATYTWTGGGSKTGATTVSGYQAANSVRYTGGEWANSDAYNTLTSCRTYRVNNNVYQSYTSGVEKAVSSSTFKWSCDGDVTGSGSGTSGNFCPSSPYGGYGSGHIEVRTSDNMYIIASATVTVQV